MFSYRRQTRRFGVLTREEISNIIGRNFMQEFR